MTQIEYQHGFGKMLSVMDPSVTLDSEAASFLDELLNDFNSDFVECCKSKFADAKRYKSNGITSRHVQQAVKKMFTPKMRSLAILEGQERKQLYDEGMLKFDVAEATIPDPIEETAPTVSKKRTIPVKEKSVTTVSKKRAIPVKEKSVTTVSKKRAIPVNEKSVTTASKKRAIPVNEKSVTTVSKKRSEPKPGAEFAQGLRKLCEEQYGDDVSLSIKGNAYLQGVMLNVTKKIVQKVKDIRHDEDTLVPQDVADAVQEIFSPGMFELAHVRGRNILDRYRHGELATFRNVRSGSKETAVSPTLLHFHGRSETQTSENSGMNVKPNVFVTPVKHLLPKIYPDLNMTKKGFLKVNEMLWRVFKKITVAATEATIQGNSNELTSEFLKMAFQKIMPQEMAACCSGGLNVAMDLHNRGVTRFKPATKRQPMKTAEKTTEEPSPKRLKKQPVQKVKPKKVESACKNVRAKKPTQTVQPVVETTSEETNVIDLDFTQQIQQLVPEMCLMGSIEKSATNAVNKLLFDLANRIMDKIVEDGSREDIKELGAPEVEKVIASTFPRSVQELAIKEGRNAIARSKELGKTATKRASQEESDKAVEAKKAKMS